MGWIVVAVVVILSITIIVAKTLQKPEAQPAEYPYKKLDMLFTPAERSFLGVLNQAVGDNAQIFGKVRVADVVAPIKGMSRSEWQRAFNKISSKHFDFLLCDKSKLSVLCAIELNDNSHSAKNRKNRDEFLSGVCNAANVPLIQIPAKAAYTISEIQQVIGPYIQTNFQENSKVNVRVEKGEEASTNEKICPKCSSVMVKRVAKKGKNIGNEFWACSAFPKCKYIEPINA